VCILSIPAFGLPKEFAMKFFVDTADVNEIRELSDTGLLDGVTTNPSLIMKSGRDILEVTREIAAMVDGPVSAEVVATEADAMLAEGRKLAKIADNIAIKVPLTWAGLKACNVLSSEGNMVNVTLCFSANQALLAAKAGATFISPFIGRLDDINLDGMEVIAWPPNTPDDQRFAMGFGVDLICTDRPDVLIETLATR